MFAGENSNGKSVIVRCTRDIVMDNIKKPKVRAELINRQATFGEITYVRGDDVVLTVHLDRAAANTYVSLRRVGEDTPIVRYLADKNYMELVREFGWHVSSDIGISLNIAEGDDALLFYKTTNKLNCAVLQSATTDPVADQVIETFQTVLTDARRLKDTSATSIRTLEAALRELKVYDVDALRTRREKLDYYKRNLQAIYIPTIPEIKAVPNVKLARVHVPRMPKISYPKIYNIKCSIPDIRDIAADIKSLRERKCPMCGRGFDNCDC